MNTPTLLEVCDELVLVTFTVSLSTLENALSGLVVNAPLQLDHVV